MLWLVQCPLCLHGNRDGSRDPTAPPSTSALPFSFLCFLYSSAAVALPKPSWLQRKQGPQSRTGDCSLRFGSCSLFTETRRALRKGTSRRFLGGEQGARGVCEKKAGQRKGLLNPGSHGSRSAASPGLLRSAQQPLRGLRCLQATAATSGLRVPNPQPQRAHGRAGVAAALPSLF